MRLIDADELKQALGKSTVTIIGYGEAVFLDEAYGIIDNAPTVEPQKVLVAHVTFDKDKLEEIVRDQVIEPIKNGELVIKEEKPQGKWEEPFESNGKTYHKCNHCHISSELILIDNFCPNCGADMREEGGK